MMMLAAVIWNFDHSVALVTGRYATVATAPIDIRRWISSRPTVEADDSILENFLIIRSNDNTRCICASKQYKVVIITMVTGSPLEDRSTYCAR